MWFKVDDGLADHRKVRKLGADRLAALGLWTMCGAWSGANLSDGFVPAEVVRRYDPDERLAGRLVAVGLWVPVFSSEANESSSDANEVDDEPGYQFHEWDEHQPTRSEVLSQRRARREAGRLGGLTSGKSRRKQSVQANGKQVVQPTPEAPASPTAQSPAEAPASAPAKAAPHGVVEPRPDPTRTPTDVGVEENTRAPRSPSKPDPPGFARFDEFYEAYPRKRSRADAEKAWRQVIRRGVDPDKLIAAATAYAEQCRRRETEAQFIKHPATWLRAAAYDDEPDPEPRAARPVESRAMGWQALKGPPEPSPVQPIPLNRRLS